MPLNQNILIAAKDYISRYGTSLDDDLMHASFPAENYKDPRMWLFSRFASALDPADSFVTEDLGVARDIRLFACLKHNMSSVATWRIRAATSEANLTAAPLYDSGWINTVTITAAQNPLEWGQDGAYEESEGVNRHAYHAPPDVVTARYIRFDFDDSVEVALRPDNYIQFARLWASDAYQPSLNMVYGAEITIDDNTDSSESVNKVMHFSPLVVKQRRLVAGFNDLPTRELLQNIFGTLFMQLGRTGELIAILHPLDPETYPFEAVYGRLISTESAKHAFHGRMTSTLQVQESV